MPKTARESAYTGTKSPYFALPRLPSPTLLHNTPQDAPDRTETLVIAGFMVFYGYA